MRSIHVLQRYLIFHRTGFKISIVFDVCVPKASKEYSEYNLWWSVSDQVSGSDLLSKSLAGNNFSNHSTEDSKHGSTSLVDFHVELVLEFISFKNIWDERTTVSSSIVSRVIGCWPDGELHNSDSEDNLGKSSNRKGEQSVDTVRNIGETNSELLGEVSWELNISVVEEHS